MNEDLNCGFLVFYSRGKVLNKDEHLLRFRIASDCLGNALNTAKEIGDICNIIIIGVSPDIGVGEK